MSEKKPIDIFEVASYIQKQVSTLRNINDIKIDIKGPKTDSLNPSITLKLETGSVMAQATFWSIGPGDIAAYDTVKKEMLFDYHCEIDRPEEVNAHIEKLIELFGPA